MSGTSNTWTLLQNWSSVGTGRFNVTNLSDIGLGTEFLWGNTTYTWSVNVTNCNTWVNETYTYTTDADASGYNARFDIENDDDVDIFDCVVIYTRYNDGYAYDKYYDTEGDLDVDIFDVVEVYNEYN